MDFVLKGKLKSGTVTNVETGQSLGMGGYWASLSFYSPVEEEGEGGTYLDSSLWGSDRNEAFVYYLKVGSNAGHRFSGITDFYLAGGNDILDLTNLAQPYALSVYVDAGSGNDVVWSGHGDDWIIGGEGSDSLWGGQGDDFIAGGEDWGDGYYGDSELDTLYGYTGNDTIYGSNGDSVDGGSGDDLIEITGSSGNYTLLGSIDGGSNTPAIEEGGDTLEWGYDQLRLYGYGSSTDALKGIEWIKLANTENGGTISAADFYTAVTFDFSGVDFDNVSYVDGSGENDSITGPASTDLLEDQLYIWGYGGSDTLSGGPTNEFLEGGEGEDSIDGGPGSDEIDGGSYDEAPDQLRGGAGPDYFDFYGVFGNEATVPRLGETIHDFEQGNDTIGFGGYLNEEEDLTFDILQAFISEAAGGYVLIDLTGFGGSTLFVNGSVSDFDESDFDFF